jgi:D-alanine-D-alanine ligase
MQQLTVAVLAGGRSSEREVSLSGGAAVREGLLAGGHTVVWVEVAADGAWQCDGDLISVTPGQGLLGVDVVFPVLHGPFGEDGTVQGLLETADVAYVGAGVAASAVCVDKVLFKELMSANAIPQVRYLGVREDRFRHSGEKVLSELAGLGLPVFVKPAHLGSSVGIAKVTAAAGLVQALDGAFAHDGLVIVEEMAHGAEVECAVLGAPRSVRAAGAAPAIVSEPGEIDVAGEWYDLSAKYAPGGMQLTVPARISHGAAEQVKELALEAFLHAGCDGLARVDFFVDRDRVLLNELNTMPGFTPTSVYAKLMGAAGVPYAELIERLCRLALERHEERRRYSY